MRTIARNDYDPQIGDYPNGTIVKDIARGKLWIFDCDGIFNDITPGLSNQEIPIIMDEFGLSPTFGISQRLATESIQTLEQRVEEIIIPVYSAVQTATIGGVDVLKEETNLSFPAYPTATSLGAELVSRRVNAIGPTSTNTQYPTARAVYQAIEDATTGVAQYQGTFTWFGTQEEVISIVATEGDTAIVWNDDSLTGARGDYSNGTWTFTALDPLPESGMWANIDYIIREGQGSVYPSGRITFRDDGEHPATFDVSLDKNMFPDDETIWLNEAGQIALKMRTQGVASVMNVTTAENIAYDEFETVKQAIDRKVDADTSGKLSPSSIYVSEPQAGILRLLVQRPLENGGTGVYQQDDITIRDEESVISMSESSEGAGANLESTTMTSLRDKINGTNGLGVVLHGESATDIRPTGFKQIVWIGTVQPTNAIAGDIWVEGTEG